MIFNQYTSEQYVKAKVICLHNYLKSNNRSILIIGISGGIDSAVTLGLLTEMNKTYPVTYTIIPVVAPILDSVGTTEQYEALNLAYDVLKHFNYLDGTKHKLYELGEVSKQINKTFNIGSDTYLQQQSDYWIRPMAFYNEAMKNDNSILVSTVNQSEWMLGWFSQYLDVLGVHPIVELYKSEVYQLAKYFNIPNSITNTSPKGGLANSNSDEDELGFTYNQFEQVMTNPESVDSEILYRVNKRIEDTKFKRFRFDLKFIYSTSVGFEI